MALTSIGITLGARCLLVALFFPFSALDKVLNFQAAVSQARRTIRSAPIPVILIGIGLCTEIVMSTAVLTGVADRLAAFILAGYCVVTALLWKQFWTAADFTLRGPSQGRDIFWDFLKNLAVAGGFLMISFGTNSRSVAAFVDHPLSSTQPYRTTL